MIKIAIYGKGGIGKSTISSNVAAALASKYQVMQIGCDPKADSTSNLLGGKKIANVLELVRKKGDAITLEDLVHEGYHGVLCVEAGGPIPGVGCAGLGIITAFQKLDELQAFDKYQPDIVLYDVLGDVVCGGFAMPIRDGYAEDVFIVTSGEKMALFAAYNIYSAVNQYKNRGYAQCSGLILNSRNVKDEESLVNEIAEEMSVRVIHKIPRHSLVQLAENQGMTVVEAFPDSDMAAEYYELADQIVEICQQNESCRKRVQREKGGRAKRRL